MVAGRSGIGALRNRRAAAQFPELKDKLPTEANLARGEGDPQLTLIMTGIGARAKSSLHSAS